MFFCLETLPDYTINRLKEICSSLIPLTNPDISQYARGRKRLWLFHEINLGDSSVKLGHQNSELWEIAQHYGCNVGLMSYGGLNCGSTGVIDWHRDHTFASEICTTINLGECTFGYDHNRGAGIRSAEGRDRHAHKLNDGNVIRFNCKHPHALLSIESDIRFGINLWQMNEKKGFRSLINNK